MKNVILALALMLGFSTNLWAAVQTDTYIYIVSENDSAVLAINRQTGQETIIAVGRYPDSFVIHGDRGYVVNRGSDTVSVIDLTSNTVIQTIPVGTRPILLLVYRDKGYVVNSNSHNLSVIDLQANTVIKTIPVGHFPQSMVIHEKLGYVVNNGTRDISVLDLQTNAVTQTIPVGRSPQSMVIHEEMGYVANNLSESVSVIDLSFNNVTKTIPVAENPQSMVIHEEVGYVLNADTNNISVVDLTTNMVIKTIPVNKYPKSIVIYGELGYVVNEGFNDIHVLDLKTNSVVTNFEYPGNRTTDFSDTHVYVGLEKSHPLYPTLASINLAKEKGTLGEFVAMMPEVFQLGEIEQRKFPKERNEFDLLPTSVLAKGIFWDIETEKPHMDPKYILATLITMQNPQKFLKDVAGAWLRNRLHMAFFQTVWMGDEDKAKAMLTYFVQLQDPVITKLATYTFKAAKKSSDQKATNSTDLD